MIKYCFAYFNKLGDFFGQPFFTDHKDEFPAILKQNLFAAEKETLESLKEDDLYYLGSFDNVTGEIKAEKTFIASMSGDVAEVLLKKYGVKEDGRIES